MKQFRILRSFSMTHLACVQGRNVRTFRGHTGPVSILADCLLADNSVLASGGLDGTVRLWALPSANHRGRSPLLATLHSHEHAVRELAVSGYLLLCSGDVMSIFAACLSDSACFTSSTLAFLLSNPGPVDAGPYWRAGITLRCL